MVELVRQVHCGGSLNLQLHFQRQIARVPFTVQDCGVEHNTFAPGLRDSLTIQRFWQGTTQVTEQTGSLKLPQRANGSVRENAYSFGPFALWSEVHLPELLPLAETGNLHPVTIRFADDPLQREGLEDLNPWMAGARDRFLLTIPETGRFLVSDGQRVEIEPAPDAHEIDLRLYLLGSVFGALCHQNGFLPLHASAIEREGRVTAFVGDSGAGKSTLAAFLARRGHTVISDDICLLGGGGDESLAVTPVAGWLKLWRQSLDALGENAAEENRLISTEDKFRVYLPPGARLNPRLACVMLLERPADGANDAPAYLAPVTAATAVARLMDMVYLSEVAQVAGGERALFERCAGIVNQVKVVRLVAPLGFERMNEVLDLIEAELL